MTSGQASLQVEPEADLEATKAARHQIVLGKVQSPCLFLQQAESGPRIRRYGNVGEGHLGDY